MTVTTESTESAITKYKVVRYLPEVAIMIQRGADLIQCAEHICNKNGWCFLWDDEMEFLKQFYDYISE